MEVRKITVSELGDLVPLFNQYMQFYDQPSDPEKYHAYLKERLSNNEATIYIAYSNESIAAGFVLNYHSFSSVAVAKVVVLNDLYVSPKYRQQGIANLLIDSSISLAKKTKSVRVDLGTAKGNLNAQALYEKVGFKKDTEFYSYSLGV